MRKYPLLRPKKKNPVPHFQMPGGMPSGDVEGLKCEPNYTSPNLIGKIFPKYLNQYKTIRGVATCTHIRTCVPEKVENKIK